MLLKSAFLFVFNFTMRSMRPLTTDLYLNI